MNRQYAKYEITKTNGEPTDVLRIDTDPGARVALLAYADQIKGDEPEFAAQLKNWVFRYDEDGRKDEACQ